MKKLFTLCINKKNTKKVNNNIIIKMDTIFMNFENSKTSEPNFKLKLTDKLDLRRGEKNVAL